MVDVLEGVGQADPLSLHRLLQRVNACTHHDQIRVLARQPDDRGRALASVARRSPDWHDHRE